MTGTVVGVFGRSGMALSAISIQLYFSENFCGFSIADIIGDFFLTFHGFNYICSIRYPHLQKKE